MRKKDEIIGNIFEDLKTAQNLGHIEKAIDLPLLEVLIDIRDILNLYLDLRHAFDEEPSIPK